MQLQNALAVAPSTFTKTGIAALAAETAWEVHDGNLDPLAVARAIAAIDQYTADLRKLIEPDVVAALEKHPKAVATLDDVKMEKTEAGVKYDYTGCPKWCDLAADVVVAKAKLSEREALLKALKKPMAETDMESGETIEVMPAQKTSKTTYKITLPK